MFIRGKRLVLLKKNMIWVLLFIAVLAPTAYAAQGNTTMVSISSAGAQGNNDSRFSSISSDGRYVAFSSTASNLVNGDTNGKRDIFLHDRETGETTRVSVSSEGVQGNDDSIYPFISSDGRFVAFESYASNLVTGDTNGTRDIFVHDREMGETTRVSVSSEGVQGNGSYSRYPSISSDGRYVAFNSDASNLVIGDTNNYSDSFVHDRETGETTRVSVSSAGVQGNAGVSNTFISADGRYVAFPSLASNLVIGDTNGRWDIFVHDRQTGETTRVSVSSADVQGNDNSIYPGMSSDGRYVVFSSTASNLVNGDTNNNSDVFVHDRETGETTKVSVSSAGVHGNDGSYHPSISSDGRYVAFISNASNLVTGDTNGTNDIFVHDREMGETTRVSVSSAGIEGNSDSHDPFISSDGRHVAFASYASNLVNGDTNNCSDIFVHNYLGLSVMPMSYDFGSLVIGNSSAPQTFTISNTGTADLVVSSIDLSDITNYTIDKTGCGILPATITPGSSCTVTVTFSPLSTGQKPANLVINSDDPDTPTLNVLLSGTGIYAVVTIITPNGSVIIPSGSTYDIQWGVPSNAVKFDLKYSMNNGTTFKAIANKVTGTSYNWVVPTPMNNKKKCLVKVIGYNASGMKVGEGTSDGTFTIEVVKVTDPDGGETLESDNTYDITWETNATKKPVAKVKLFYTINGGATWNLIRTLIGNPGSYNWKVPAAASANCKVKVVLKDANLVTVGSDVSDGFFTIQP